MKYSLTISDVHYQKLIDHLFPGDLKESVAVAVCGIYSNSQITRLLVHDLLLVPHDVCTVREKYRITWPTEYIIPLIEKANNRGLSIVKIHCHPEGGHFFSDQDDQADGDLFPSLFGWIDNVEFHASCIMLPGGKMFGRVFNPEMEITPIEKITHIGHTVRIWHHSEREEIPSELDLRNIQAFGEGTVNLLKQLRIALIGCSGTGAPVFEQLVRLGVGEIILIDPDIVEAKNLNRIPNTTMNDVKKKRKKVDVLKEAAEKVGFGTIITTIPEDVYSDTSIIKTVAGADFILGCVDSIDARHLLNQISTFYLIPYIDVGVFLKSDGAGGIEYITGTIHYIQPGGSSLISRGVYTSEDLRAALMKKFNPENYSEQERAKYIVDVNIDSPAVISVNTQLSSMAINELLAILHGFRYDESSQYSVVRVDILNGYMMHEKDGDPDAYLSKYIGRGDTIEPLLNMPELSHISRR